MEIGVVLIVLFAILLTIVKWGLIIWGIVWFVRYLKRIGEERQRFRMEVSKIAEEVHLLREELKGNDEGNLAAQAE